MPTVWILLGFDLCQDPMRNQEQKEQGGGKLEESGRYSKSIPFMWFCIDWCMSVCAIIHLIMKAHQLVIP